MRSTTRRTLDTARRPPFCTRAGWHAYALNSRSVTPVTSGRSRPLAWLLAVRESGCCQRSPGGGRVPGTQSASAASASRSAPSAKAVLRSPLERRDATDAKMTAPMTRAVWISHGSGRGPSPSVPGRGPGHGHGHFLGHGVPHQSSMISLTKADEEMPCASDATASRTTSCAISAAPANRVSRGGNGCGLRAALSKADTTRTRGPCGMTASQISGWIVPMMESRLR